MDFYRFAYLSRAQRELGNQVASRAFFGRAATTASASVGAPVALAELLDGWEGWSEDLRTFLWRVAETPAERSWALRSLFQFHAQRMDTAGLLRVSFSWRNNRHLRPRLRRPMNSPEARPPQGGCGNAASRSMS